MGDLAMIEAKFKALSGRLDEATLRIWAATEARSLGRGGVSAVAKAIGMSRTTIHAGLAELLVQRAEGTAFLRTARGEVLRVEIHHDRLSGFQGVFEPEWVAAGGDSSEVSNFLV